jgi:hypothetical protein
MQHPVYRLVFYSNLIMFITTIHHIYGAFLYSTPWRLHVLLISLPVPVVVNILMRLLRSYPARRWILYLALAIIFIFSMSLIGIYEGVYNHAIKNVLFFSKIDQHLFTSLFPPPVYEAPNDFLFEFSGAMQGVLVVPLGFWFVRSITYLNSAVPKKAGK